MSLISSKSSVNIACLLIVYKRFHAALEIVDLLRSFGIQRMYIAIDRAPKHEQSSQYLDDLESFSQSLKAISSTSEQIIYVWKRESNFGCALSVVTACDWLFSFEEAGIVLEDDCLPQQAFIEFVERHRKTIETNPQIMMLCGTQHATIHGEYPHEWVLSNYPFLWGWYTNREKWYRLRRSFQEPLRKLSTRKITLTERFYWKSGSRRAIQRFVDVWDTPMVANMIEHDELAILPISNLVNNIGNDMYATNFSKPKNEEGTWKLSLDDVPSFSQITVVNESIRKNFFQIRKALFLRNIFRQIFDIFKTKRTTLDQALILPDFQIPLSRTLL